MQTKILSRSSLKYIALITMLIDHIGAIFGLSFYQGLGISWLYYLFRTIGRISFPIFAFFIAEGWFYTSNKLRYFLTLLLFALISQPAYYFALNSSVFSLNILFTFILSLVMCYIVDLIKKDLSLSVVYVILMFAVSLIVVVLNAIKAPISYGLYGVFLSVLFYIFYHSNIKKGIMWVAIAVAIILYCLPFFLANPKNSYDAYINLFALLSLPLIYLYNGQKGKHSPKWLFYIFYPAHITLLYLITLLF